MTAGKRREKIQFQTRGIVDDGAGNEVSGDWETQFTEYAELLPLKGSEAVLSSRLAGVQPYVIRIPGSAAARSVAVSWRAVDARNPSRIFNITSAANLDQRNAIIDIMATQGIAT